jgi:hypothetical protein
MTNGAVTPPSSDTDCGRGALLALLAMALGVPFLAPNALWSRLRCALLDVTLGILLAALETLRSRLRCTLLGVLACVCLLA